MRALFLILLLATPAAAETIDGNTVIILDGDTVALRCDPAKGIYRGCAEKIRLADIDAPKTSRPRCDAELGKGLEAKARLSTLLRGARIEITRTAKDRYGRTLGHITAGDVNVETDLLATGLAVPYQPGRAAWADRCRHWCGDIPRCGE